MNPAVVLLGGLRSPDLETRLVDAPPWLAWKYNELD